MDALVKRIGPSVLGKLFVAVKRTELSLLARAPALQRQQADRLR
jgi:hypothetical protein